MPEHFYRRNLPHWQPEQSTIFVTWRLYGSLPKGFAEHLRKYNSEPGKQFIQAESVLDAASNGPQWLADPRIAESVQSALHRGEKMSCLVLHAYVIMPNHVHVMLKPLVDLKRITKGIKGASARDANMVLGRTGKLFWQDESFDHWIRDYGQFEKTKTYIENNPVKARLCAKPQDWPWSSARL